MKIINFGFAWYRPKWSKRTFCWNASPEICWQAKLVHRPGYIVRLKELPSQRIIKVYILFTMYGLNDRGARWRSSDGDLTKELTKIVAILFQQQIRNVCVHATYGNFFFEIALDCITSMKKWALVKWQHFHQVNRVYLLDSNSLVQNKACKLKTLGALTQTTSFSGIERLAWVKFEILNWKFYRSKAMCYAPSFVVAKNRLLKSFETVWNRNFEWWFVIPHPIKVR